MKSKRHTSHKADDTETTEESAAEETAAEERKAATEPWKSENAPDAPAKRGILGLSKTKPGHELRWVRLDAVDRRKNQGYELATPEDFDATPDENGMIRRNELVLMTCPTEVYQQRRAEVAAVTAQQSQAPKREYLRERAAASRQSGHDLADESRERDRDEE